VYRTRVQIIRYGKVCRAMVLGRTARAQLRYTARRPRSTQQAAADLGENGRFAAAGAHTLRPGAPLNQHTEREWAGPFMFAQLADTQFGMFKQDESWAEEEALAQAAVRHINRLKPKFVVVCGDLVNALPNGPEPRPEQQAAQVRDFKRVMSGIDESIQLVCVCGNHDVGDRPNAATIDLYESRFGDTYFGFWAGGCRCIVLNSSLHASQEESLWDMGGSNAARFGDHESPESVLRDKSEAQARARDQDKWLEAELASGAASAAQHSIVFTHIPPFIEEPEEPKGYFNYDPSVREPLLRKLRQGGVSKWFCGAVPSSFLSPFVLPGSVNIGSLHATSGLTGHYHRNAGGVYSCTEEGSTQELEVVTTSAVGTHLIATPEATTEERLGLGGFSFPQALSEAESGAHYMVQTLQYSEYWDLAARSAACLVLSSAGFRLVAVGEERISHKWFSLASMPTTLSNVGAAAADDAWATGGSAKL
jgi:3',5'-cyclic AMP phosphodiesterase CpdA